MRKGSKSSRASEVKLKAKAMGRLGDSNMPVAARLLVDHYTDQCVQNGRSFIAVKLPDLPPSLNHQYKRFKNKHTGKSGQTLTEGAKAFRQIAELVLNTKRHKFKEHGIMAAVVLFEGDNWLTKDLRPKEEDVDNRIKPTMDSMEVPLKFKDQEIWEVCGFKCASKKKNVWVWLFDLGNEVEIY